MPHLDLKEMENLYDQAYFDSPNADKAGLENIQLVDDYANAVESRIPKFNNTLNDLTNRFPESRTFLDIGAATGEMVMMARQAGYQAEGVEFSDFAVNKAREKWGIILKQTPLSEMESESFDIVHLNHVFEHFTDPVAELKNIHRILTAGGGLYIEIPYQFHVIERLKHHFASRSVPFSLHSIHHPFFYTPKTIQRLLRDHGFHILKLNVFAADRYPALTPSQQVKRLFWRAASWVSVGNYIEIMAIKRVSPDVKR
jgi:SAM-dependent methyltransferase